MASSSAQTATYSTVARVFHWLTAILVFFAFILSVGGPEARVFAASNLGSLTLHESLGISVIVLTVLRMVWRLFDPAPAPVPMPGWMHQASDLTHLGLFALLLAVPLSAVLGSWLEGHALVLYVFGDLNSPLATSAALGQTILGAHKLLGDAIMWLAGLHAAAAIFHHFVLGDDVLRAMLPLRKD